jgi:hypothetical protein
MERVAMLKRSTKVLIHNQEVKPEYFLTIHTKPLTFSLYDPVPV